MNSENQILQWMIGHKDAEAIIDNKVFGKDFPVHEKAPTMGFNLYNIYGRGVLYLFHDVLIFIGEPPKGWKKIISKAVFDKIAGSIIEDFGGDLVQLASGVFKSSDEKFLGNISNGISIIIPLKSIHTISGGKYMIGLRNFYLEIFYSDANGDAMHAYFFSPPKVHPFNAYSFRKEIEKQRNKL